jgi:bla regulator protein BlaR1
MIFYIFKSILCLAVLLLVYRLFLEKEKMHRFNRWYLLGSIVFACLVPLVSFEVKGQPLPILQDTYFEVITTGTTAPTSPVLPVKENIDYVTPALLIMYGLITSVLLARFITNIYRLLSRAAKNKVIMYEGARLILLKEKIASHSFLNNIFISEEDYADHSIEEELITHELTHVREKHSWDVIFIELLQTIFWFNPIFIFYKKAIQLNHEYLADDAVIKTYEDVPAYQYLLLDKASCTNQTYLTSNFNFSVTKKRLVMMTRTTNQVRAFVKKLAVLPVLAGALLVFSSKFVLAQDKKPQKAPQDQPKVAPKVSRIFPWDEKVPYTTEGISADLMNEYNSIAKKYLYTDEKGYERFRNNSLTTAERDRLESIFKQMNRAQQSEAIVGFAPRMEPWGKATPTDEQFEKWKDETNYGVWIDGKKVKNEELNKYKASDFSHYYASNLAYTEQMKKDVMKSFNLKVMYKVQLDLMTHTEYDDYYQKTIARPKYEMFYRFRGTNKDGKNINGRMMIR